MLLLYKKTALIYISAFFLIALDRFFKVLSKNEKIEYGLVYDFFVFTFAANENIAFSLPFSGIFLIILIGIILVFLLVQFLILLKHNQHAITNAMVFLILGAFSNLYDRLRFGYVVDYLYLKYFTVFNIADMMIVGGAALIVLYYYRANHNS